MDDDGDREDAMVVDAPILVFGGPYSNLEATQAVLAVARLRRIPPERVICTGDVVAYGADAAATVALVRAAGIHVVMGNCEEQLAAGAADCGCGFAPGSECDRLAADWYAHTDRTLGAEARLWMAGLPRRLDLVVGDRRLAVIHGGVDAIARFVFASTPEADKDDELDRAGVDGIIAGHCGLPFTQVLAGGRLWHNPGVVGMPANDGTPRGWFSILTPRRNGLTIEHRAFDYPHEEAAAKMRAGGLPEGYAAGLETGLWPSLDVLPEAERRATGVAIHESVLEWRAADAALLRAARDPISVS